MFRRCTQLSAGLLCLAMCSCGSRFVPPEPTYPVTGEVYVDGQPTAGIEVTAVNLDPEVVGGYARAVTDEQAKFALATYVSADGPREGRYALTFSWRDYNYMSGGFTGPDKLGGRYSDPKTSEFVIDVVPGSRTDLGRIELTTK